ncbi:Elongator complex protein 1 [Yarrowia sp. B02]|nr:Elongator complex protein 1 [Yarrowia sp. B02]
MRNLQCVHRGVLKPESVEAPDLNLVKTIYDPLSDAMVFVFDGLDTVEVQQFSKTEGTQVWANFPVSGHVIACDFLWESQTCIVFLSDGNVYSVEQGDQVINLGEMEGVESAVWSPDQQVVALGTKDKVLVLSRTFDPLSETPVSGDDLKLSRHVSVGWGSAETQFRGRGAKRDPTVPEHVDIGHVTETDDSNITLCWRPDGEWLAQSSCDDVEGGKRRTVRVYSRDGQLFSVSEPVDGLLDLVAWGTSLIACVAKQEVVFFERNGLRHGGFHIGDFVPIGMQWNSTGEVLALWSHEAIRLYTTKNYRWYLKQEIVSRLPGTPKTLTWHPEKARTIIINYDDHVEIHEYTDTVTSEPVNGVTCVIDGKLLLVTPLKLACVPPPMSRDEIHLEENIVAVSSSASHIAVLTREAVHIYDSLTVAHVTTHKLDLDNETVKAVIIHGDVPYVLAESASASRVITPTESFPLPSDCIAFAKSHKAPLLQLLDGNVYLLQDSLEPLAKLPRCSTIAYTDDVYGLTSKGKLYKGDQVEASHVTSLISSDDTILYTTAERLHLAGESREIEKSSLLVSAHPSTYSVVLQAPRGNLETIHPRPLVLKRVAEALKNRDFKAALTICRTHRVDLNFLHDHDPELFMAHVSEFVDQVSSNHLDLFLTEVGVKNNPKGNEICDAVLANTKNLQNQITAHSFKNPPDVAAALALVDSEESLEHLCFLHDVNHLYDTSLGLYDLEKTLLVAQQSQKDPKEYLPFLQKLQVMAEDRRKFTIDDHLEKYAEALESLIADKAGHEEIDAYITRHVLYNEALKLYTDKSDTQRVLNIYAAFLESTREFKEAGIIYESLEKWEEALEAYKAGVYWEEALCLCHAVDGFEDKVRDVADELAPQLVSAHCYKEASTLYADYLDDIMEAVRCLCLGSNFVAARALAARKAGDDKERISKEIDSLLSDAFGTHSEFLADCQTQVKNQVSRLHEVRQLAQVSMSRELERVEDDNMVPDDISLADTASTSGTFLTKYTGKTAGTAKTGVSRRTAKNKRRMDRKKAKGKKGTVFEEEYLVASLGRLVERLEQSKVEIYNVIQALYSRDRRPLARQLQQSLVALAASLTENVQFVFNRTMEDRKRIDDDGAVYYLDEVPVPEIKKVEVFASL